MKQFIITFFLLVAVAFGLNCGGSQTSHDWEEYDEPFYANQQPSYVDGDYYIFVDNGRYRRVRRARIQYVNPIVIPIMPDIERERVYREIPRKSTVPASRMNPGAANLTTPSKSTVPASRTNPSTSTPSKSTVPASRQNQSKPSTPTKSTVPASRSKK